MAPAKAKVTAAEEVVRLRDELRVQQAEIEQLRREKAARAASEKRKTLIPRPQGQAGRSSGYNIQDKILLSNNTVRYKRLYRIVKDNVHERLNVTKTLTEQDKVRLERTIAHIAMVASYFAQFEGYWPIHDMISGYLRNARTRRNKDLALEKLADARDAGDSRVNAEEIEEEQDEDDDDDEEPLPPPKSKKSKSVKNHPSALFDDEDDEPLPPPKSKKSQSNNNHPSSLLNDQDDLPPPPPKSKNSKVSNHATNKRHNTVASPAPSQNKKRKRDHILSSSPEPSSQVQHFCPTCDEEIPLQPSARLLSLLDEYQKLIESVGKNGAGVTYLEIQICAAVSQNKTLGRIQQQAASHGWPTEIDFATIPIRIHAFLPQVYQLIQDPAILRESPVWRSFCLNISRRIFYFSRCSSKLEFTYALLGKRAGYYGPKGGAIIETALLNAVSKHEEQLSNDLFDTLHEIVIDPRLTKHQKFDMYDETSNLINLTDFVRFILTPFVANLLIEDDLGVDPDRADMLRDASNAYGEETFFEGSLPAAPPQKKPKIKSDFKITFCDDSDEKPKPNLKKRGKTSDDEWDELTDCTNGRRTRNLHLRPKKRVKRSLDDEEETSEYNGETETPDKKQKQTGLRKAGVGKFSLEEFEEPAEKPKKKVAEKPKKNVAKSTKSAPTKAASVKARKPSPVKSSYVTRSKSRA
ncbi:hypothetical protein C8R46DRAFT_1209246 [Mycena filopes]|nr:hypothetical protein C8R46DRAFT_1209246 [Mycena filopes]